MAHAISMERSETRETPNERLEVLKARYVFTPDNQHQLGDGDLNKIMDRNLYEATKKGEVKEFIDALEKVAESRNLALSLIFNQVTPSGNSLLHAAASSGNDDVMELILNHFPYTRTQENSSKDTPLHVAVQNRRLNAAEKLIRLGTNSKVIYWKNEDNKSPLYLAVEQCTFLEQRRRNGTGWEILQLLLQESTLDEAYAVNIQGKSPVLAPIEKWRPGLLEEIIHRLPMLLQVRDEKGGTPLHFAASFGNSGAVELLLKKCPYLALQTDENGSYPIHIACEWWSRGTISTLIKGTWPDLAEIKNKKGQNILHIAAKGGDCKIVQHLLKECGERDFTEKLVNSKDVDGNTPLHLASVHNHCDVMRFLTEDKRINLKLRNNDGSTALDVAMESISLSTKNPALLGRAILIVAGVPQSKGRDVPSARKRPSRASKSSPAEQIKDQIDTLLLVATLVASVTFTAGVALPGGYNTYGDPHPGTATMLHHGVFQVFVIANMFAMCSSILVVVALLWSPSEDLYVAELAYRLAGPLLSMALTSISVAFFAAITVAVSKLTWLGSLVLSVGVLYLMMVVVVLMALIFPTSKSIMHVVIFYYRVIFVVEKFVYVPKKFAKYCFRPVVRVCKCIF